MQPVRHWRTQKSRYRLVGVFCGECGHKAFPPRRLCRRCGADNLAEHQFLGLGEVYSYSTVYQAPRGFTEFVPYTTALVRLQEGPLVATQLTDAEPEAFHVGMAVQVVTRRVAEDGPDGVVVYGYKFRPVLGADSD